MDQSFSKEHLNWIKATLALRHVKQGLVDISNETAKQLHEDILKKLTIQSSIAAITKCSDCNPNDVTKVNVKYGSGWKWTINCSSNVCNAWLEEILRYHKHSLRASVAWANCDPSLWSSDPWEVAKVFQGPGSGGQKGAEDNDCAGLLVLLQDCTFFSKLVQGRSLVQEVGLVSFFKSTLRNI